jgi:carbonic anhydrase/acetyltransferase-like protein (isoleucine patch superfamily)
MPLYSLNGMSPRVHETAWVADTAVLIGEVDLDVEASTWFGAVLRGDNEIIAVGSRSNIQDNAVLHTDRGFPLSIGDGCTIGHKAMLHGCTIGENTLVGMGATILNGARIGSNCLIGANALVTEGKVIPDNSLVVGAPGKVVRLLDESAIARLRRSAETYVEKVRLYRAHLIPIR